MTEEEAKIRAELETDIEKDLEEEIKGQICRLALHLHHLYQNRKNRHDSKTNYAHVNPGKKILKQPMTQKNNDVSEIHISINKDGETKVEIRELKKKAHRVVPLHVHKQNNRSSNSKYGAKKFEWTQSLRSGPPKSSIQVVRNKVEGVKHVARRNKVVPSA
ncbi:hypothetical protein vseg_015496 [Gypsophila vaccaria]